MTDEMIDEMIDEMTDAYHYYDKTGQSKCSDLSYMSIRKLLLLK